MNNTTHMTTRSAFEKDVIKGLTDYPKHLSSKFIYDKKGDKLFQDIWWTRGFHFVHMLGSYKVKRSIGVSDDELRVGGCCFCAEDTDGGSVELNPKTLRCIFCAGSWLQVVKDVDCVVELLEAWTSP